jgi:hypothetical protein
MQEAGKDGTVDLKFCHAKGICKKNAFFFCTTIHIGADMSAYLLFYLSP